MKMRMDSRARKKLDPSEIFRFLHPASIYLHA
jgi:hypothetical protein